MSQPLSAQTQSAIIPSEYANLRRALDEAAIISISDLNGNILFVNDRFCRLSKYSREELLGKNHRIINSAFHPKEFFGDLWRVISSGRIWRGDIRNRAKNGSVYWEDTTIIPLLSDDGRPFQYMSIRFEITEKKKMEDEVRELSQRIIVAQEEERGRIAQVIHDDFGQLLIALKMFLAMNAADFLGKDPAFRAFYDGMKVRIDSVIDKARNLSHELALPAMKYTGLVKALKELIHASRGQGFEITFVHRHLGRVDLASTDILLYRIIQEALTNIAKHACAKHVAIRMLHRHGKIAVSIKDDGKGFNVKNDHDGLGLALIRERAKLMGASLQIVSARGKGTLIRLSVPVQEKSDG